MCSWPSRQAAGLGEDAWPDSPGPLSAASKGQNDDSKKLVAVDQGRGPLSAHVHVAYPQILEFSPPSFFLLLFLSTRLLEVLRLESCPGAGDFWTCALACLHIKAPASKSGPWRHLSTVFFRSRRQSCPRPGRALTCRSRPLKATAPRLAATRVRLVSGSCQLRCFKKQALVQRPLRRRPLHPRRPGDARLPVGQLLIRVGVLSKRARHVDRDARAATTRSRSVRSVKKSALNV